MEGRILSLCCIGRTKKKQFSLLIALDIKRRLKKARENDINVSWYFLLQLFVIKFYFLAVACSVSRITANEEFQ